jgi:hypothetical protein
MRGKNSPFRLRCAFIATLQLRLFSPPISTRMKRHFHPHLCITASGKKKIPWLQEFTCAVGFKKNLKGQTISPFAQHTLVILPFNQSPPRFSQVEMSETEFLLHSINLWKTAISFT